MTQNQFYFILLNSYFLTHNYIFKAIRSNKLLLFECLINLFIELKNSNLCDLNHLHSTGIDLALLSLGNHSILTYGTFGMWGALLAGGETVLPSSHRCQFHQHFTSSFFVRKCFAKPFSTYFLLWLCNILAKKYWKMLVKLTTEEQRSRKKSKQQICLAGKSSKSVSTEIGIVCFGLHK